ncbi:transcription factor GTE8-like isoform X1 [Mangifera indica]|uniref:transcription factor GTE8-like isoform X1 n=1 Tax=Mangifera indica TaxID=29780 RepID=UPI001CF9DCF3|nr:transcription factor GTE8-like isoform X1 [Mangifera indica]XP_044465867.1 transcription factor GTE8-like isoform X1 [Mangifera indica]XP_044465868.1 transcription factor GTE8-like isoform X1 [Mangifera indica]
MAKMMGESDRFSEGYYRNNTFQTAGESEGSGSSGRIDTEITPSEDSSAPTRKCININSANQDAFGVPMQILALSKISPPERKDLLKRLRIELEQIRIVIKKVELQRTNGIAVSSSSDILSCSNGQSGPQVEKLRKSSVMTSGPGKKMNNVGSKGHGWNHGTAGKTESAKIQPLLASTANILLMKQCETLLKRLMSHQYGWVFNKPVDVVKLNIPDYFTVIKHPMDLGTIKGKIASSAYSSPSEFLADVRLTFSNAMTYNPPGNDVHIMADTLRKFFEARWKAIEKKLPAPEAQLLPRKKGPYVDVGTVKAMPTAKKRKIETLHYEIVPEPVKPVMTAVEKQNLGKELESMLGEMPMHIIDFLREHSSDGGGTGEDEIEIDIDELSDDTLFTLRKLLDDFMEEKQKNLARAEPCEIELLNESGLSNSSMQQCKEDDPANEDIDIGGNEPPVSSYPPVEIEKDTGIRSSKCVSSDSSSDSDSSSSTESESSGVKASTPINVSKVQEALSSGAQLDEKTSTGNPFDGNQSVSELDQGEHTSQQKPSSVESDYCQDGDSARSERQVSPGKLYRAALLKNRFADTILKAREKTLSQGDKGDPEKLRKEREELELQRRKEKVRLQAEANAAEEARRQAEEEAAAEAKRKREVEREAARQALLKMEKTVEINENSRFLEDLEMLRTAPAEHLPSSVDETSPDHSQDGLGSFKFRGSNPLEQLGLYMKDDDEEEEAEPPIVPNPLKDIEEGEID